MCADKNIETVKAIYEQFSKHHYKTIVEHYISPDIVLHTLAQGLESEIPWYEEYKGAEGVVHYFKDLGQYVTFQAVEPKNYIAKDNDVIVPIHVAYTIKKNGKHVDLNKIHLWKFDHGKVCELIHYEDTYQVANAWRSH